MKKLFTLVTCSGAAMLSACQPPPETSALTLPFLARTNCELVYKSSGAQVVENFCETKWNPVTVHIADQKYSVQWIDEVTSRHLFENGCGQPARCFYELKLDGVTVNGRFVYVTDVEQGEYTFEIDANENSKLLNDTSSNLPS